MNKPAELAALEVVKNYVLKQNRPYSVNEIFENLHKEHGKTLIAKCMDCLVEQSVLREKLYGKQKIYFPNQDQFSTCTDEELLNLDVEIKEKISEMKELLSSVRNLESELKMASNSLTTDEIVKKIEATAIEIEQMNERLKNSRDKTKEISLEEKEEICKNYDKYVKEWRSRKRMASGVLDSILENCPKKKKELFEDIGIETDEDYKVSLP